MTARVIGATHGEIGGVAPTWIEMGNPIFSTHSCRSRPNGQTLTVMASETTGWSRRSMGPAGSEVLGSGSKTHSFQTPRRGTTTTTATRIQPYQTMAPSLRSTTAPSNTAVRARTCMGVVTQTSMDGPIPVTIYPVIRPNGRTLMAMASETKAEGISLMHASWLLAPRLRTAMVVLTAMVTVGRMSSTTTKTTLWSGMTETATVSTTRTKTTA